MSTRIRLLVFSFAAMIVVAGAGLWWYLRDDAPAAVTLEAAVATLERDEQAATTVDATATTDPAATPDSSTAAGLDGSWTVDTSSGTFDYESATGTFVGFRITEELSTIGSTEAVGRTGDVTGSVAIDGTTLTAATFEADVTTITTNDSMRDGKVQNALDTDAFPTATFVLSEPVELGDAAATGDRVSVMATGALTIHGVTTNVTVPIEAQLVGGTAVVVASMDITFSDYGVEVPSSPIVVSVEDHGTLELQLLLARG